MAQILRTVLIPDEAQSADGAPSFDLPVNPLSHVLLTVKALNLTATIADYRWITALLAMITDVRITYRGASIIQGSLADLAVMFGVLADWGPWQGNAVSVDNDVRMLTVPLVFGRRPYDAAECFPATRRGDLVMQLTTDVAVTGADGLILQAETCELLEATPQRFTKITTTSKISNAVSEHDIELPIGNDLLGVLLRDASPPQGVNFNAQFGRVAIETDNVETVFAEANWETLHGELLRRGLALAALRPHVHHMAAHIHTIDAAAAGDATAVGVTHVQINADANNSGFKFGTAARTGMTGIQPPAITHTLEQEEGNAGSSLLDHYAYLDLDPMRDGAYALKTAGAARLNLRVDTQVASATAMRVLPVELVPIAGAPAA